MVKMVKIEPNWRNLLKFMDEALRTDSVIPDKREMFQKERDKVAAYVTHLDKQERK